jgi:hypothetical protein
MKNGDIIPGRAVETGDSGKRDFSAVTRDFAQRTSGLARLLSKV